MSSSYTVAYSPAAQEDVRDIYAYIAYELQAKHAAQNQIRRIRDAIRGLETMPRRYESVDWEPWLSMGMRRMPVDSYLVFYLVDDENKVVVVNRVFYGGRNIEEVALELSD